MDDIQNWFEEQKGSVAEKNEVIDKIISGISNRGFDNSHLNQFIQNKLENIASDYEFEFNTKTEDEN
tara:strand:+ start:828 stop:1028 length:201 start_codon:yes stop_codon:yes gene_type:complete